MKLSDIKLAAYLDEAGEDPQSSCKVLVKHHINYVILRDTWTGNVCSMSDNGHSRLKSLLSEHDISAIMIASTLGKVEQDKLLQIEDQAIINCINICKYYKCKYLRIFAGLMPKNSHTVNQTVVNTWVRKVADMCLNDGIKCLYEVTSDSVLFQAADIAKLLSQNTNLGLIYDAAGLIIKRSFNPYIKHWPLLKSNTDIIDIRDVKIGQGFKVAGHGDSKIDMTIKDAIESNYKGWFAIEPSLGRKFASATTKEQTFAYAVEGIDKILDKLRVVA